MARTQTFEITNFSGALTREINGPLNSGMAKFATSWGYDPFSQPGNLTWNYQPTDLQGTGAASTISGAIVAGVYDFSNNFVFLSDSAKLYSILPTGASDNSPTGDLVQLVGSVGGTYIYGGDLLSGIAPISNSQSVLGTSDSQVWKITTLGSSYSVLGTIPADATSRFTHPLVQFLGKVYMGVANNLWEINNFAVTNTAVLTPPLPRNLVITDLDLTPEGDYMVITATLTGTMPLNRSTGTKRPNNAGESYLFYWNGVDAGTTAVKTLPAWPTSAYLNFLDKQYVTQQDAFGMALYQGNTKLLTLPNNVFPSSNALISNGNFLTWTSAETSGTSQASSTWTSLYYYGQLDQTTPQGLYRMLRVLPTTGASYSSAYHGMINDFYMQGSIVAGYGKHYFTTQEIASDGTSAATHFYRFVLAPGVSAPPVLGIYETQTQLFSKRISVSQVRVYCDPTVSGNGFRLDLIGSDGTPIPNGTFTYTFGDISDPQSGSQSIQRINFQGDIKSQYSLGVRITNTGSTNMVIRKVEVDTSEEGK